MSNRRIYKKIRKRKEDITKEAAMNIVQEAAMRSVWFMISENMANSH